MAECFLPDLAPIDWLSSLRRVAPSTPLVFGSGVMRIEALRREVADFRAAALLEKPFTAGQLVQAVRRALPADGA